MRKALLLLLPLGLTACGYRLVPVEPLSDQEQAQAEPQTGWLPGAFDSNGERIYFTGTNEDGERIRSSGGPRTGMMMGGYLACASCHGPDARGGLHVMHMQVMDAPDIRWSSLVSEEGHEAEGADHEEFDLHAFRQAVVHGMHTDGEPLSEDMPRWEIQDRDLEDLASYLQSIP